MTHTIRRAQNPCRRGSIDRSTIALLIAAVGSLILIAAASALLLKGGQKTPGQEPDHGAGSEQVERSPSALDQGDQGAVVAPSETVEQVLESVQVYVSREEYAQARAILEGAVRRYPSDAVLRYALGDLLMRQRDFSGAYDQFVGAIEVDPEPDASSFFTAGTLASTNGQKELAEAHYAKAMELDPSNPEYPLYLSNVQLSIGKVDAARASVAIAAKLAPSRAEVWATWAKIALRENALEVALQQARKAKAIQPTVAAWSVLEATVLKRMGEPEQAVQILTALGDTELEDPEAARTLADCYGMLGDPENGAAAVLAAARAHDGDPRLAFEAAVWLERSGDREEALKWARRARDLGHDRAGSWIGSLAESP